MTLVSKLKDQFLGRGTIDNLERDAEHRRKHIFAELEKNNLELETEDSGDFWKPQIEWNKKVLGMEPKYLTLKKKFKDDPAARLSLVKDWSEYLESLEYLMDLSANYVSDIWGEFTTEQKEENKHEEQECQAKLAEIENRFERLVEVR